MIRLLRVGSLRPTEAEAEHLTGLIRDLSASAAPQDRLLLPVAQEGARQVVAALNSRLAFSRSFDALSASGAPVVPRHGPPKRLRGLTARSSRVKTS